MKPFHFLLLSTALFVSCNTAQSYLHDAEVATDKKNYNEAIRLFDKAIEKSKSLIAAYNGKGYCLTKLGMDDSAIIVYSSVLNFIPDNTLALYNIGYCKLRQEKPAEAVAYFKRSLRSKGYDPDDTTKQFIVNYTDLGKELMHIDAESDVPLSELFFGLGLAYYDARNPREAKQNFENCIQENYKKGESYYMIGHCWIMVGRKDEACRSFDDAVKNGYEDIEDEVKKYCR